MPKSNGFFNRLEKEEGYFITKTKRNKWFLLNKNDVLYHGLLAYIFRTVDRSKEEIRNLYAQHVQQRQLVCGDIRYGMNHTDANFDRTRKGMANSSIILSYIKETLF